MIKNVVLNIVMGILAVLLLFTGGLCILAFRDSSYDYTTEESIMLYMIGEKRYASLIRDVNNNQIKGITSDTYEECYAVVEYFEAASFYKAYKEAGDETLADKKADVMNEWLGKMGELEYVAEDINAMLDIP